MSAAAAAILVAAPLDAAPTSFAQELLEQSERNSNQLSTECRVAEAEMHRLKAEWAAQERKVCDLRLKSYSQSRDKSRVIAQFSKVKG
jgi:hypothetical protein